MRCGSHEPFTRHDQNVVEGGWHACAWPGSRFVYFMWLIASCIFHTWFCTDQEDVDKVDVSSVPAEVLRNIEADTYWCMSKLLDGIQVSWQLGRLRGLRTTCHSLLGRPLGYTLLAGFWVKAIYLKKRTAFPCLEQHILASGSQGMW